MIRPNLVSPFSFLRLSQSIALSTRTHTHTHTRVSLSLSTHASGSAFVCCRLCCMKINGFFWIDCEAVRCCTLSLSLSLFLSLSQHTHTHTHTQLHLFSYIYRDLLYEKKDQLWSCGQDFKVKNVLIYLQLRCFILKHTHPHTLPHLVQTFQLSLSSQLPRPLFNGDVVVKWSSLIGQFPSLSLCLNQWEMGSAYAMSGNASFTPEMKSRDPFNEMYHKQLLLYPKLMQKKSCS